MKKVKNLDLIIILVTISILGIITAIILAVKPYQVKSFDDITEVNINNYKSMKGNKEEYLVFSSHSLIPCRRRICLPCPAFIRPVFPSITNAASYDKSIRPSLSKKTTKF